MPSLTIDLLGPPAVTRGGVRRPAPKGKKVWALLAYLIRSEAPISRERLASMLFADADDPLGALRWSLSELRRLIGDKDLLRGEPIMLDLSPDMRVDVDQVVRGTWREAASVDTIGGTFLEGLSFPNSPAFETWLLTERRHLANAGADVIREAAMSRLAAGAPEDAVSLATKLVEVDPLDESYQALLIRSLAASGDRPAARAQLEACRLLLSSELGVQPGPDVLNAVDAQAVSAQSSMVSGRASAQAQLDAGRAAISAGAVDAGLMCLRRAVDDAHATPHRDLQASTLFALGSTLIHYPRGRDEEGSILLRQSIVVGEEAGIGSLVAGAKRELGYVEMLRARYDRARAWLEDALTSVGDDVAEEVEIRTVLGGCMSDTAHYSEAIAELEKGIALAAEAGAERQIAFAASFLGRALLLTGSIEEAQTTLMRAKETAEDEGWTSLVPWPESLLADCMVADGDLDRAMRAYEHAFALGCQLGDPCWEGMAARGIGLVKARQGKIEEAVDWLDDATTRCVRTPDAYLWIKAYCEDALCELAVTHQVEGAKRWVNDLESLAARTNMREYVARAYIHLHRLGDPSALAAAGLLVDQIDNPSLHAALLSEPVRR